MMNKREYGDGATHVLSLSFDFDSMEQQQRKKRREPLFAEDTYCDCVFTFAEK